MKRSLSLPVVCVTLTMSALSPSSALAQARVEVRVRGVEGALSSPQLARLLRPTRFVNCQRTFSGGSVWLTLHVDAAGMLTVDDARTSGEEVGVFVGCVRRVVRSTRVGPQASGATARVEVRFPALGLAVPRGAR